MAKDFDKPRGGDRGERPSRGGRSFDKRGGDDAAKQSFKSKFKRKEGGSSSDEKPASRGERKPFEDKAPRAERPGFAKRRSFGDSPKGEGRSGFGEKKSFGDRGGFGKKKSFGDRPERGGFDKKKSFGDRSERGEFGAKKSFGDRPERGGFNKKRSFGDRSERSGSGAKKSFGDRPERSGFGAKKSFGDRPERGGFDKKKSFGDRSERSGFEAKKSFGDKAAPVGKRPMRNFDKPVTEGGDKFFRGKPFGRPGARKRTESGEGDRPDRKSFVRSRNRGASVKKSDQGTQKSNDGLIRLNRFISNSGVCSRREADELIKMGLVTVNGETIIEMGHKVKPNDDVRYEGKRLKAEKPVYILLNKPKGFITTTDDPQERKTVMNLIANACKERVYPVGRLDRNTTGLMLLTNDGELADKLTHPSYSAKKIYKAELDKPLTKNDFDRIQEGVRLEEGKAVVDDLAYVSDDKMTIGVEIHIGWNRVVRRIFESFGYEVVKLDRVVYAGLDKKDIGRGEWRFLKPEEVVKLKHFGQQKSSPKIRGEVKVSEE
jgi:23S rRNA pseudouridine2605 synthase